MIQTAARSAVVATFPCRHQPLALHHARGVEVMVANPRASSLRGDELSDPAGEGLHELLQKFLRAGVREIARVVEELRRTADIGFRLLQRRDVEEDERLAQMMVGAE